jgi:hypothetical protein
VLNEEPLPKVLTYSAIETAHQMSYLSKADRALEVDAKDRSKEASFCLMAVELDNLGQKNEIQVEVCRKCTSQSSMRPY